MSTLNLHNQMTLDVVMIPGIFIDKYVPAANGEFVKIYLYLLRVMRTSRNGLSIPQLADIFDHTEKDIMRALTYWEKLGLLRLGFNSDHDLTDIILLDISLASTPSPIEIVDAKDPSSQIAATSTPPVSPLPKVEKEVTIAKPAVPVINIEDLSQDDSFSELLFIAQTYMKKTFKSTDCDRFAYWYMLFDRAYDVIEYLVEYCVELGHANLNYMEKVALSWHEQGLTSVRAIKDYTKTHNQITYGIMKAYGLSDRAPGTSESAYIEKWTNTYAFSLELIQLAIAKTLSAIQKPSFEYTDSILSSWKKNGVTSKDDVLKLDASHQAINSRGQSSAGEGRNNTKSSSKNNKFHNFEQRNTDYDELVASYYGYRQ
ncbi:MAG: DnaD domain protein [Lachnospiraceae bacterium]